MTISTKRPGTTVPSGPPRGSKNKYAPTLERPALWRVRSENSHRQCASIMKSHSLGSAGSSGGWSRTRVFSSLRPVTRNTWGSPLRSRGPPCHNRLCLLWPSTLGAEGVEMEPARLSLSSAGPAHSQAWVPDFQVRCSLSRQQCGVGTRSLMP